MIDTELLTLTDPRTGAPRLDTPELHPEGVHARVDAARTAAARWAGLTTGERARRLLRLADVIEQHSAEYVVAECAGTGKPAAEAAGEIAQCIDIIRFYAGAARTDMTPGSGHRLQGRESWVRWEPLGVVAAIVPWTYPMLMAIWRLGPALAAGNAVVLKPALTTPDSALLLAKHAADTLGPDVLQTVPGGRATGRALVDSAVDAIAFTGSLAGGLDVQARAGVRRVSLELGGNCPVIVLPDAPMAAAYRALTGACTYNAGQSCAAPARVITLVDNYEETVAGLAQAMQLRRAGVDFGPLNSQDQLTRYDRILAASGARTRHVSTVEAGVNEAGGYWRPGMILADLPAEDPAVVEEVFGPVLTVQVAADTEAAVRMANALPHALAASVWGAHSASLLRVARALDAGEVWINCHLEQTAELPHGGRRQSGSGTDLSVLALSEYQRPKTITMFVEDADG